jgi:multiple sugar transport system substrate-binding protein
MEGVTLVYEPGGSESSSYQDVLRTELAAGTAPDVFWIPGTDVADFASRGLIMDMREHGRRHRRLQRRRLLSLARCSI